MTKRKTLRRRLKEKEETGVEERRSPRQHKQTRDKHMRASVYPSPALSRLHPSISSSSPVPPAFKVQSDTEEAAHQFSARCLRLRMSAGSVCTVTANQDPCDSARRTVAHLLRLLLKHCSDVWKYTFKTCGAAILNQRSPTTKIDVFKSKGFTFIKMSH